MTGCNVDSIVAADMALRQAMGQKVPESLIQEELSSHGQAVFAKKASGYDDAMASDNAFRNPNLLESHANKALGPIGFVSSWLTYNTAPSTMLGENFIRPLIDALHEHKMSGGDYEDFKQTVQPVIKGLYDQIQSTFQDHARIGYAERYLSHWDAGGTLYNTPHEDPVTQAVLYLPRTVAGNLVSFSPFIAGAHLFQFGPKSLGLYGIPATIKGVAEFAANAAQHGIGSIPELQANGLYSQHPGLLSKLDPVTHADNVAKGLSYYVGKAAGTDPLKAVQDLVYRPRLGDESMISWNPQNAQMVFLMRYAMGGMKMYGGWYKNIVQGALKGDLAMAGKGAAGLGLFTVAQSLLTGSKSAIPAPVWALMTQQDKDQINQIDENTPYLDVVKKATRGAVDLGHHFQPLGGLAFGVGYDLANSDFRGGSQDFQKALLDLQEHDYNQAAVHFVQSGLSVGQALVPGVNTSIKKAVDVAADVYLGHTQPEQVPTELAQKFHFMPKG